MTTSHLKTHAFRVCTFKYSVKKDVIKIVTNHTDFGSDGTNIRIETKYPHGLNNGDVIEIGSLQRSDDLNYYPVAVKVLDTVNIELKGTEHIRLPSFLNTPTGTINLLERDVDSTAFNPYTLESQSAPVVNVSTSKPVVVRIHGTAHSFVENGITVSFSGLKNGPSNWPVSPTATYLVSNVSYVDGETVVTLANSDSTGKTIVTDNPVIIKDGVSGTVGRGDVMAFAANIDSSASYTSVAIEEPTKANRLLIPDQTGTFITSGNLNDIRASNGAVHSMKIEHGFSVGGDTHLGTAGDGSATFVGGTLEVDGGIHVW